MENSARKETYGINHASILRRFMAFIIDSIVLVVAFSGFMALFSWAFKYDESYDKLQNKYIEYGIYVEDPANPGQYKSREITIYNEDGSISEDDPYIIGWKYFYADEEAKEINDKCNTIMNIIIVLSGLISLLILEFALPLLIKNGRTIGGWAMHVGLISKEGVRPSIIQLFARCVIGRFAIETMIPIYSVAFILLNVNGGLLGLVIIIALASLELLFIGFSKHRQSIHDIVANLVCVDSNAQYFAKSKEELDELIANAK